MKKRLKSSSDLKFMMMALRLARKGEGCTRPNPPVGAVITKHGRIAGSGYHKCAGGPHAEIHALQRAGSAARGGTLYVTLEPCSTWGKTGPCTDAIIDSGIKMVHVATLDPNPRHAGKGIKMLRAAGIIVNIGLCEDKALELINAFGKWIINKTPHLTLKLATSIDGKIADLHGQSKWITGPSSRGIVNRLRIKADAVMVGIETILKDNPTLLPKGRHSSSPFRIIVDSSGRIPTGVKVLSDGRQKRTFVATTRQCSRNNLDRIQRTGAKVIIVPGDSRRVSLPRLMRILGKLGVLHVICEGGGEIAASLINSKLVDDFYFFMAPIIIGGVCSRSAVAGRGWTLHNAPRLVFDTLRKTGNDILIHAKPYNKEAK